jgi:phosphate transport system substrate-binding protein
MNDDFLRRMRKAPPPEFLDGLKARLERQSPLARPRTSRLPFARGLIVGLLLGSAAFAVTSLAVNRAPASFADFLKAPVQLIAALGNRSSQGENGQQRRVIPWGPVWGPKHPVPTEEAPSDTGSAAFVGAAATDTASAAATATARVPELDRAPTQTPLPAVQSASPAARYFGFTVVAPPATYPHAQAVSQHLAKGIGGMKVSLDTGGDTVSRLCSADDKSGGADLIELPGRITPSELRNCDFIITELKVGHQAVVTARSNLYGSMTLSARALFLALSRYVPVPSDPSQFIDNPYTTWNQIDNTLPDDRIRFLGPGIGLVQGKLAALLLLEVGCNTYPRIADLRITDPARYDEICLNIRADGAYEDSAESSAAIVERLEREPTLLGVFSLSGFDALQDRLAASVINGVLPSPGTVAAGTYPSSRTLYLYTKQNSYAPNTLFGMIINAYLAPVTPYPYAPGDWGFIPLDDTEHADVEAILHRLHPR